ncbi:hypothetical protein MSG28_011652 [Choristoneura fumiferana]|uniref:Uncharacterized protein n=1 Tax=Choristoneura fumiferana TaxID=7141 RepID=A0ACC0KM33_CHOFU|nr:hypothetical protein MSG28_011652 [Choristoneura fumiferana]
MQVPQLVRKYGYPVEVHQVSTSDGYILTMHRIRHGKDHHSDPHAERPVVFLMHGLLSSSADWVVMGPSRGLGPRSTSSPVYQRFSATAFLHLPFLLWHILHPSRRRLRRVAWERSRKPLLAQPPLPGPRRGGLLEFSWDEIGNIDVPAMIDHALVRTGKQQLHYVGHSQGTTSFFVMCSLRPAYNRKIISMNALAPVAYMAHSGSNLRKVMAPFSGTIIRLLREMGVVGELFPTMDALREIGAEFCRDGATTQEFCAHIMVLIGWNSEQFNKSMIPVQLGHVPAGASARQFAHYGQNMHYKEFRRFHHSYLKNLYYYGSFRAPSYDLANVRAPVYLHYAMADTSAHYKDVRRLKKEINNVKALKVPMKSFNHLDFLWGIDAKTLVYDKVVRIIKSYSHVS